jgi:hypothetical protein
MLARVRGRSFRENGVTVADWIAVAVILVGAAFSGWWLIFYQPDKSK